VLSNFVAYGHDIVLLLWQVGLPNKCILIITKKLVKVNRNILTR